LGFDIKLKIYGNAVLHNSPDEQLHEEYFEDDPTSLRGTRYRPGMLETPYRRLLAFGKRTEAHAKIVTLAAVHPD